MPRKLLARFQFLSDADQYFELLEKDGIPYYLSGTGIEQEGQTNYSESLEVWVDETNFDKAVQAVKQNEYFSACPNCGSKDLSEAVMENLKSNLNPIAKIFMGFRLNSKNKSTFYNKCNNCGNVFQ